MPLVKGHTQAAIGANIAILRREGRPEDQAVAIAYAEARKHRQQAKGTTGPTIKRAP